MQKYPWAMCYLTITLRTRVQLDSGAGGPAPRMDMAGSDATVDAAPAQTNPTVPTDPIAVAAVASRSTALRP